MVQGRLSDASLLCMVWIFLLEVSGTFLVLVRYVYDTVMFSVRIRRQLLQSFRSFIQYTCHIIDTYTTPQKQMYIGTCIRPMLNLTATLGPLVDQIQVTELGNHHPVETN